MTIEIKTIILTQALDEISQGIYPTVSSHGDYHIELEKEVKYRYETLIDTYNYASEMLELVDIKDELA